MNKNLSNKLPNNIEDLLEKINTCCFKIAEQKNLNCKFKKIDFLKDKNFYDNFPNNQFIE